MNYRLLAVIIALFFLSLIQGQTADNPKLIVGLVVDQMRFDYLYRYSAKYGDGGFKRILREGYNFKNAQFSYIITETAPGHSTIFTGTTPSVHGIVGNDWYDRESGKLVSNVGDGAETIVGSKQIDTNGRSPRNLLSTTIGDQLRLGSNFRSKVISISLKDRSAILPGGHTANAAYWIDLKNSPGYFVSSSFYMDQLPSWVQNFNAREKVNAYLDETWETLYPIGSYSESIRDNSAYEPKLGGKSAPVFPYNFKEMRAKYPQDGTEYQLLLVSPWGNTLLKEFALEALKQEGLGKDVHTDLLTVSFSVPDVVGHTFGPQSVEMQDIYLRLDKDIEALMNELDREVGKENYLIFLTADHGAIPNAHFLKDQKLPTGIAPINLYTFGLSDHLSKKYRRQNLLEVLNYEQAYLNRDLIRELDLDLEEVQKEVASYLLGQKEIVGAFTAHDLMTRNYDKGYAQRIQQGFHPKRSGDVILQFLPGFVQQNQAGMTIERIKGTTHGSGYSYDSHVPLIWAGKGIPKGESVRQVNIKDITPTLSMMLNVQLPSGSTGKPLTELFE